MTSVVWRLALTLALACAGGALFAWLGWPLPWLLGPLIVCAAARIAGAPVGIPSRLRALGQWLTGIMLGLAVTPAVLPQLPAMSWAALLNAAFAVWLGWFGAGWFARAARVDTVTAHCSTMPGGASEMVVLAERYGGRADLVATAHAWRVVLVVVVVPALFAATLPSQAAVWQKAPPIAEALVWYGGASALAMAVAVRLHLPNAAIIGPLLVCAVLSASAVLPQTSLPPLVGKAGQVLLGAAMGCRFERDFLRAAPRILAAITLYTLSLLVILGAFGSALAWLASLPTPAVLLGVTPGGIAEMGLTAVTLGQDTSAVLTFQIVRLLAVLFATHWLLRAADRRRSARSGKDMSI